MSEFEESISAPNERQFLCAVSAFSSVHGASPHLLPGGDSKQRFVNKLVDYICNNDMCSKNIAGVRASVDCIRICFRSNTDMEAAETDRFVKALNAAASNAFISEAAHAGNTAVDAVDVIMRCISNGAFQSPAFASLIHDNAFHDTVLSILKGNIPLYLASSCSKLLYLLSSQCESTAISIVGEENLLFLCATAEYCMYNIIGGDRVRGKDVAIDVLSWLLKLFYATESIVSSRPEPIYQTIRMRIGLMCRHMFSLPDGSALIKEDLFSLQSLAIQILTLCPSPMLPLLLFAPNQQNFDRKASDSSNQDLGNRIISMADYLLKVFSVQFWREETTALSLTAHYAMERYPILILMTHLAQADEIVRQYWKDILLPDVSNSKELTGSFAYTGAHVSLGSKLLALMLSPNSTLKRYSSEFLFCLCDNNAEIFTKKIGIGHAIWFLKIKGFA